MKNRQVNTFYTYSLAFFYLKTSVLVDRFYNKSVTSSQAEIADC